MMSAAAQAKFDRSGAESTAEERRGSSKPPPDPQETKVPVQHRIIDSEVRVLQCCSALSNFGDVMTLARPGANADAFEEATAAFCADIAELRIKTTIKIHIVDEHISTFVKSHSNGFSLAAYSKQAMEACHYRYEQYGRRYSVPDSFHSHAAPRVLASVVAWNGCRISFVEHNRLKDSRDAAREAAREKTD